MLVGDEGVVGSVDDQNWAEDALRVLLVLEGLFYDLAGASAVVLLCDLAQREERAQHDRAVDLVLVGDGQRHSTANRPPKHNDLLRGKPILL